MDVMLFLKFLAFLILCFNRLYYKSINLSLLKKKSNYIFLKTRIFDKTDSENTHLPSDNTDSENTSPL